MPASGTRLLWNGMCLPSQGLWQAANSNDKLDLCNKSVTSVLTGSN